MQFINFHGHKKTSNDFLNNIKSISNTYTQLIDNIRDLNIFDSIIPNKKRVILKESSNSANFKISSNGKKLLSFNFPNICGKGEFLNFQFNKAKDFKIEAGKPFIKSNKIYSGSLKFSNNEKFLNEKKVEILNAELSLSDRLNNLNFGVEKIQKLFVYYSSANFNIFDFNFNIKSGLTKNDKNIPFIKFIVFKDIFGEYKNFFVHSSLKLGKICGQTNILEKFFLGSGTRGYKQMSIVPINQNKKLGGNSFLELRNRIGFSIKNIEIFVFGDVGVNSIQGFKNIRSILSDFGDNSCIGKSMGIGLSLKNCPGVSFLYSIPFTSNSEFEKYSISFDMKF